MTNTHTDTQIRKPSFKSPSSSPSLRASCNSCLTDLTGNGWQLPSTSFIDPFYTHVTHVSEVSLLHMRHHQPVRVNVWMSQHHSISLFVLFGDAAIIVSIKVPQNFIDTPEAARFEKTPNEKGLAKIGCATWPLWLWWEIKIEINNVRDNTHSVAVHCLSNSHI